MGIFDEIRKIVTGNTPAPRPPPRGARAPAAAPKGGVLDQAQRKRREAGPIRGNDGKVLTERRLKKYESLERALVAEVGTFPWTDDRVLLALQRRGFDRAHVEAYLRSPAAKRLVE